MLPADIYPLIICNLHDRETWISARYVNKLWYAIITQIEREPIYEIQSDVTPRKNYVRVPRLKNKMVHGTMKSIIYIDSLHNMPWIIFEKCLHDIKYVELCDTYGWENRKITYIIKNKIISHEQGDHRIIMIYENDAIRSISINLSEEYVWILSIEGNNTCHIDFYYKDPYLPKACIKLDM